MFDRTGPAAARFLRRTAGVMSRAAHRIDDPTRRVSAAERAAIAGNAALRNLHAGRPAFVIGNGPSLKSQDLGPLADRVTFVSNAFWRHGVMNRSSSGGASTWQPTYYAIIDPLYTDGSEAMAAFFEALRARVTRSVFLVSTRGWHVIREQRLLPAERVRPCLFHGDMTRTARCSCDLAGPLPELQSVSLLGILAALHTGCAPIYLLGLDHDWAATPKGLCEHFYAGSSVDNHPTVRSIERSGAFSYRETLEAMARLYRSYERVAALAASMNVAIINVTRGGFLDVFPRDSYERIVGGTAGRTDEDQRRDVPALVS